jgi:hypothetical protein
MKLMPQSRASANAPSPADTPKLLLIAALVATLIAALVARIHLPSDAWLPVVATVLFALAATATLVSFLFRPRATRRMGWLDLAGIFTCIGIILSLAVEPEAVAPLLDGLTARGR